MLRFDRMGALAVAAALLITAYGALLRLDALVQKYGTLDHPRWAAAVTRGAAAIAPQMRPFPGGWPREPRPYEGGDPLNYLRFAREMQSFYQAHVREPVFLALTRVWLWLLGDQDVAVSFASLVGSVLAVLGTWLAAARLMPPVGALAAAFLVAVEFEVITWAPDGWRDDTFMAAVLWTTWAFLRARQAPSFGNALLLGGCAGIACLTRITALSFVLPGLIWLAIDAPAAERRERLRRAGLAAALMVAIVAPYLISCAIGTGDPFIAINYHTVYYRHGEGLPTEGAMSAAGYLAGKFGRGPLAAFDVGFNGLFVQPFITKWGGLGPVLGRATVLLVWCAVAGLLMLPGSRDGRLFLVNLLTSLLPYAFTWNIGGGNAWRFTMHVYPLYIIAGLYAVSRLVTFAGSAWRSPRDAWRKPSRREVVLAGGVAVVTAAGCAAYVALPWLVVREAIAQGHETSIETGPRDLAFYRRTWSPAHTEGVTFRVSQAERAVVHIPLVGGRSYELVLRIDPVVPSLQQRLSVLFNRQFVARFPLTWNPERVGAYRLPLHAYQVRNGSNEVVLIPDTLVAAGNAGPRFAWLKPEERIGIRLWYVRILPKFRTPNSEFRIPKSKPGTTNSS
jgi:hypothetical protein